MFLPDKRVLFAQETFVDWWAQLRWRFTSHASLLQTSSSARASTISMIRSIFFRTESSVIGEISLGGESSGKCSNINVHCSDEVQRKLPFTAECIFSDNFTRVYLENSTKTLYCVAFDPTRQKLGCTTYASIVGSPSQLGRSKFSLGRQSTRRRE